MTKDCECTCDDDSFASALGLRGWPLAMVIIVFIISAAAAISISEWSKWKYAGQVVNPPAKTSSPNP